MSYLRPISKATERRLEDEAAVLVALRAAEQVPLALPERGLTAHQLFGWCPPSARPEGWSRERAELAAVRLANRRAIEAVRGAAAGPLSTPRRWRLG